jgi:hypothetical protein
MAGVHVETFLNLLFGELDYFFDRQGNLMSLGLWSESRFGGQRGIDPVSQKNNFGAHVSV